MEETVSVSKRFLQTLRMMLADYYDRYCTNEKCPMSRYEMEGVERNKLCSIHQGASGALEVIDGYLKGGSDAAVQKQCDLGEQRGT